MNGNGRNGDKPPPKKPTRTEVLVGVVLIPLFLCGLVAYDLGVNRHVSEIVVSLLVGYGLTLAGFGIDVARWLGRK